VQAIDSSFSLSPSLSLEPFRINHDIQLMSSGGGSGGGIVVGPSGSDFGGAGLGLRLLLGVEALLSLTRVLPRQLATPLS
jgi:hypothetical protein